MRVSTVHAATLTGGSVSLSDSRPDQTSVEYDSEWSNVTQSNIKCIKIQFNTAADGSGSVPLTSTGGTVDTTNTDYVDVSTWTTDFTTNGTVTITDSTGAAPTSSSNLTIALDGITNGSTADTGYYYILNTYDNTDCSTSPVDEGTVTFIYTEGQSVSMTVDPSISFSLASVGSGVLVNGATTTEASTTTTIPLGTVTDTTNGITAHDLTVSTNAENGYTVYARYTGQLTYSTATIDDHTGDHTTPTEMSVGTEAFGYTTEDTDLSQFQPNKWAGFTSTNASVATNTTAASSETTRIGYQAGISSTTEAGTYTTTVILTCTPTY
ncbi:MAG: hypothetical protein U9M98_02295 [Patescibacteria group bacterium]|nr:hypothetical protein [Patescibacteria group bacterium]